jgi:L-ascorbate oxidase
LKLSFRYIANDPGTHLWHSHSGLQRADGLFGAIIVRQNEQDEILSYLYDYDLSEHLVVMNDWYDDPIAYSFALHVHTDRTRFNWADSILINGRGSLSPKVNFTLDSKNYTLPDAVFKVNSDYRYRFRLVHAGISHCAFQFSIQNHNLKIIATDGNFVEPFDVEALLIYPGNLYFRLLIIIALSLKISFSFQENVLMLYCMQTNLKIQYILLT